MSKETQAQVCGKAKKAMANVAMPSDEDFDIEAFVASSNATIKRINAENTFLKHNLVALKAVKAEISKDLTDLRKYVETQAKEMRLDVEKYRAALAGRMALIEANAAKHKPTPSEDGTPDRKTRGNPMKGRAKK